MFHVEHGGMMGEGRKRPGYVYILSHPAFPGLLKIGMTGLTPEQRSAAVSQAMPSPCVVEHSVLTWEPRLAEERAHYFLDESRERGEWFRVGLDEAKEAVRMATISSAEYDIRRIALQRCAGLP